MASNAQTWAKKLCHSRFFSAIPLPNFFYSCRSIPVPQTLFGEIFEPLKINIPLVPKLAWVSQLESNAQTWAKKLCHSKFFWAILLPDFFCSCHSVPCHKTLLGELFEPLKISVALVPKGLLGFPSWLPMYKHGPRSSVTASSGQFSFPIFSTAAAAFPCQKYCLESSLNL